MSNLQSPSPAAKVSQKPSLRDSEHMVNVIVGPEDSKTKFVIHRSFITHASPFFKAAFSGNSQEGKTKTIRLEDISADTFDIVSHWIYEESVKGGGTCGREELVHVWNAADKFLMPELQNSVIGYIWQLMRDNGRSLELSIPVLRFVYDSAAPDTPLKRIVVQHLAWSHEDRLQLRTALEGAPMELLTDVLTELQRYTGNDSYRRQPEGVGDLADFYVEPILPQSS